jgi:hypothetical protein
VDNPLSAVQQKLAIIRKQVSAQFNPQITRQLLPYRCIPSLSEDPFQAGKGRVRVTIECQRCDPVPFVIRLARNTVG